MPARTTREAARQRLQAVFAEALDRVIPADEAQPLRGRVFREWEDQADEFRETMIGCLLEERAALEASADREADDLGCCRHCGSDRLYLQRREPKNKTIRSPHGEVVLGEQSIRCRACGKSFSPSAS
jgi:DNA-directed RNA polymerase subunit RPC12/RpoP